MMTERQTPNRFLATLLAAGAALGMTAATAQDADAARRSACQPAGSKTILASRTARVFTRRGPRRPASADPSTVTRLYGCRSGRRPVRMAIRAVFSAGTLSFKLERLAGSYASAVTTSDDRGGYSEELEVFDLRRRRRSTLISPPQDVRIRDVELRPSGNVAWIQAVGATFEVRARQGAATVLLDSGRAVNPASLASSGPFLYWTNGSQARTARLP